MVPRVGVRVCQGGSFLGILWPPTPTNYRTTPALMEPHEDASIIVNRLIELVKAPASDRRASGGIPHKRYVVQGKLQYHMI